MTQPITGRGGVRLQTQMLSHELQVMFCPVQVKGLKDAGSHRLQLLTSDCLQPGISTGEWQAHSLVDGGKQPSQFKIMKQC